MLVVFTLILGFLLEAVLLGGASAAVLHRLARKLSKLELLGVLLAACIVLDTYWRPAVLGMDITCSIGDHTVRILLGLGDTFSAAQVLSLGWFDLPIWIGEAIVAFGVNRSLSTQSL